MSRSDDPATEADEPAAEPVSQPAESPPAKSASRWWVAAVTFVAGVVVGVLAVGLLAVGKPDFVSAAENGPSAGATQAVPTGVETAGVTGSAVVNVACLRVINEAQDVYTALTGVDQAVRDVDLQQLDDIVRQLQPIEPRLQRDLLDCRVDTSVETGPTVPPTGPPTAPATQPTTATTR